MPVFTDACEIGYRMQSDWRSHGPRSFFYPSNYISLGWAFPAAIGAAVAVGDRPVVSVSGDGGFVMTAQELATTARYRLRVIGPGSQRFDYGAIKNIQKRNHEHVTWTLISITLISSRSRPLMACRLAGFKGLMNAGRHARSN